jgi:hypothetical protein
MFNLLNSLIFYRLESAGSGAPKAEWNESSDLLENPFLLAKRLFAHWMQENPHFHQDDHRVSGD